MNKKQLYESILKEVSKQVKNTLNENDDYQLDHNGFQTEPKYAAINFVLCRTLVDTELEEIGKPWEWVKDTLIMIDDNIDDLLNRVKAYFKLSIDTEVYAIGNKAYIRVITDKDLNVLNNAQLKRFHNGAIEGYQYEISFTIMKQVMNKELNYNGLENI